MDSEPGQAIYIVSRTHRINVCAAWEAFVGFANRVIGTLFYCTSKLHRIGANDTMGTPNAGDAGEMEWKWSYDDGMRLKHTIAVLMAIFLFAGPSCAVACDLACAGAAQRHVCSICGSAEHTAAAHMHCGHMESPGGLSLVHAELTASPHCTHLLCKQTVSAVLPTRAFQPKLLRLDIIRPAVPFEADAFFVHAIGRVPPPRLTDSRRPLILALRI